MAELADAADSKSAGLFAHKGSTPFLGIFIFMKKTKRYQKGKHLYIKCGKKKEVHILRNSPYHNVEYAENYLEIYANRFLISPTKNGIKISFGKEILGTDRIKFKHTIIINLQTAYRLVNMLKNIVTIQDSRK